jgi:hypothetical protein
MRDKKDGTIVWETLLKPGKTSRPGAHIGRKKVNKWEGQGYFVNCHNFLVRRSSTEKFYDFIKLCDISYGQNLNSSQSDSESHFLSFTLVSPCHS